jgi:hypothetical protein
MSWQPIETAPRDGTTIHIRQGSFMPHHAFWRDGRWCSVEYMGCYRPTHWAPCTLPEPPEAA